MSLVQSAGQFVGTLYKRVNVSYFAAILLSSVITFTPLRLLSLLIIVFVLSRLLTLNFGALTRFMLASLVFFGITSSIAGIAWLSNQPLSSGIILSVYNISLLLVVLGWSQKLQPLIPHKAEILNADDWLTLLLTVATFAVLVFPVASKPSATTLAPVIMAGGDNSTHIELVKLNDLNKGYTIGLNNRTDSDRNTMSYPQGWHFNAAFLKWTIEEITPLAPAPGRILAFYYILCVLWFCTLVFLGTRLALALGGMISQKRQSWAKSGTLIVCATIIAGWFIPLFVNGFQTELGALALLLAELYFLIAAYERKSHSRYSYFLLASLMIAGINYMWVFLAPVAVVPLALCIIQTMYIEKRWPPLYFFFWAVAIGASAFFQIAIQLLFPPPSSVPFINSRGFIQPTAMYILLAILVIISVYTYVRFKNIRLRLTYLFALASIAFSLGLMIYQLRTIHELRYYYFKSTYTFILVAMVFLAAIGSELVQALLNVRPNIRNFRKQLHTVVVVSAVFMLGSILFWSLKSVSFDDLIHERLAGISKPQATALAQTLGENTLNGYRFVPIGSCNRGDDIRALLLAHALAYAPLSKGGVVASFELSPLSKESLFKAINLFLNVNPENIIVASNDQVISKELLVYLGSNQRFVKLINIDSTPKTEPVTQCPDRIRTLTPAEVKAIDG